MRDLNKLDSTLKSLRMYHDFDAVQFNEGCSSNFFFKLTPTTLNNQFKYLVEKLVSEYLVTILAINSLVVESTLK